jgi:acyl carrier protein
MHDWDDRLVRCFAAVFPKLATDHVRAATMASVPGWDSLAFTTLIAVLEQEFGIQIDVSDSELNSFESIQNYLSKHYTPS